MTEERLQPVVQFDGPFEAKTFDPNAPVLGGSLCMPFWMAFPSAHGPDVIHAVNDYLARTPVEDITVEEVERIAGERPTKLVVRGRVIVGGE